jgi:hypothetical protein
MCDTLKCPTCTEDEFFVSLPEREQEPCWIVTCRTCLRRYELLPNGVIVTVGVPNR